MPPILSISLAVMPIPSLDSTSFSLYSSSARSALYMYLSRQHLLNLSHLLHAPGDMSLLVHLGSSYLSQLPMHFFPHSLACTHIVGLLYVLRGFLILCFLISFAMVEGSLFITLAMPAFDDPFSIPACIIFLSSIVICLLLYGGLLMSSSFPYETSSLRHYIDLCHARQQLEFDA